jgi:hypothetical protein
MCQTHLLKLMHLGLIRLVYILNKNGKYYCIDVCTTCIVIEGYLLDIDNLFHSVGSLQFP